MIAAHLLTTEVSTVRFAGSTWPLVFDFRAIRKLGQHFAPGDAGLGWLRDVMGRVSSDDIDALTACLWAGMLRETPGLTFDETLALLDEATPAELVALPHQVLGVFYQAFGESAGSGGGDSDPWDWEMALAIWIKEWGRSEDEFWRATFRTFTSISNGLSRLYQKAEKGQSGSSQHSEGFSLMELLTMKGR